MIQPSNRVTSSTAMNPPISGQYMARNTTRRRAARPARWPTGTPTPPAGAAPGETRTAAGWAVADPRGDWGGRSRRDPSSIPHRAGSDGRSSPHNSPVSTLHGYSSRPVPLEEARPHRRASKPTSPPRCNDDFRKSQEVHIGRNTCKQRELSKPRANSARFEKAADGQERAPSEPPRASGERHRLAPPDGCGR